MTGLTLGTLRDSKHPAHCPGRPRQLLGNQPGVRRDSGQQGSSQLGRWGAGGTKHLDNISTSTPPSPLSPTHSWDHSQVCTYVALSFSEISFSQSWKKIFHKKLCCIKNDSVQLTHQEYRSQSEPPGMLGRWPWRRSAGMSRSGTGIAPDWELGGGGAGWRVNPSL